MAKHFNDPVVKPPRGVAVKHAVLVAKHMAQKPLRVGDGGVAHDLVCGQDVHGLGLECLGKRRRQPGHREDQGPTARGRI